jgi:hypothetical protein
MLARIAPKHVVTWCRGKPKVAVVQAPLFRVTKGQWGRPKRLHPFQHLSACVEVGDRGVCAQEAQLPRRGLLKSANPRARWAVHRRAPGCYREDLTSAEAASTEGPR